MKKITIATRKSALAMWQTQYAAQVIEQTTQLSTKLLPLTTEGDRRLEVSLNKIGGKGLFLKELEQAMLNKTADIAVHSMKDVPADLPEAFSIAAVLPRADASDAFISNHYQNLAQLPPAAIIGTSSLRRQSQLLAIRPDLQVKPLRGNVNSRLQKLDDGQYDAIILATAGLLRLGFEQRIIAKLSPPDWLPAVSQGAIGIECRSQDQNLIKQLQVLNHQPTWQCVQAERSLNAELQGSCSVAIGAYAQQLNPHQLQLQATVLSPDGSQQIHAQAQGDEPQKLGQEVARQLLKQGAKAILQLSS